MENLLIRKLLPSKDNSEDQSNPKQKEYHARS